MRRALAAVLMAGIVAAPSAAAAATCKPWPQAGQPGVVTPQSCYHPPRKHPKHIKVRVNRHGVWVWVSVR